MDILENQERTEFKGLYSVRNPDPIPTVPAWVMGGTAPESLQCPRCTSVASGVSSWGGHLTCPNAVQLQHVGLCKRHDGADGGQQTGPYAKSVRCTSLGFLYEPRQWAKSP